MAIKTRREALTDEIEGLTDLSFESEAFSGLG
jgi:hypothetical protein